MTNRHIAIEFSARSEGKWIFRTGHSASIDYGQDLDPGNHNEFVIEGMIGTPDEDLDLALLRVRPTPDSRFGKEVPKPLILAKEIDEEKLNQRDVYAVGFPFSDPRRNDPEAIRLIFGTIFGVKRVQPGKTTQMVQNSKILLHDCSTMGGNSGSCLIDLETNRVAALHFRGKFLQTNRAVALWKLVDDPLLTKENIKFV